MRKKKSKKKELQSTDHHAIHVDEAPPLDSWVAKKDWQITQNEYHRVILKGDDLSDVPERFHVALKTEGVL